jgi:hypothetical protein
VVSRRGTHAPRRLTETVELIVAHAPESDAERFQVQRVFAGKIVHYESPISTSRLPAFSTCVGSQFF